MSEPLTCDVVATVWRMLQGKYPDLERRYRELAARREKIQAEIEQWKQAQAYLERVDKALRARDKKVKAYQSALEDLGRAKEAYAKHPDIPVYVKRWLNGVGRWARRVAEMNEPRLASAKTALLAWKEDEAEKALGPVEDDCLLLQGAAERLNDSFAAVLAEEDQGLIETTQQALDRACNALDEFRKWVKESRARRADAEKRVQEWRKALAEGVKAERVSWEVDDWLEEDHKHAPQAAALAVVQQFLDELARLKGPEEHWQSALRYLKQQRYKEARREIKLLKQRDADGNFRKSRAEKFPLVEGEAILGDARNEADRYLQEEDYVAAYRTVLDAMGEVENEAKDKLEGMWKALWEAVSSRYQKGRETEAALAKAWSAKGWHPIDLPLDEETKLTKLDTWFDTLTTEERVAFLEITAPLYPDTNTPRRWRMWHRRVVSKFGKQIEGYYVQRARSLLAEGAGWRQVAEMWRTAAVVLPDDFLVLKKRAHAIWFAKLEKCADALMEIEAQEEEDLSGVFQEAASWAAECREELDALRSGREMGPFPVDKAAADVEIFRVWEDAFSEAKRRGLGRWTVVWNAQRPQGVWERWHKERYPLTLVWPRWWKQVLLALWHSEPTGKDKKSALEAALSAYDIAEMVAEGDPSLLKQAKAYLGRFFEPPGVQSDWMDKVEECLRRIRSASEGRERLPYMGELYYRWAGCVKTGESLLEYGKSIRIAADRIGKGIPQPPQEKGLREKLEAVRKVVDMLEKFRLGGDFRYQIMREGGRPEEFFQTSMGMSIAGDVGRVWGEKWREWRKDVKMGLDKIESVYRLRDTEEKDGNPYAEGLKVLWVNVAHRLPWPWKKMGGAPFSQDGFFSEEEEDEIKGGLATIVDEIVYESQQEARQEQQLSEELKDFDLPEPVWSPDEVTPRKIFGLFDMGHRFPIDRKLNWEDIATDLKEKAENLAFYQKALACVENQKKAWETWKNKATALEKEGCSKEVLKRLGDLIEELRWWYACRWNEVEALVQWQQSEVPSEVGEGICLRREVAPEVCLDWQAEAKKQGFAKPLSSRATGFQARAKDILKSISEVCRGEEEKKLYNWCTKQWKVWYEKTREASGISDLPEVDWQSLVVIEEKNCGNERFRKVSEQWQKAVHSMDEVVREVIARTYHRKDITAFKKMAPVLCEFMPSDAFIQWWCKASGYTGYEQVSRKEDTKPYEEEERNEFDDWD